MKRAIIALACMTGTLLEDHSSALSPFPSRALVGLITETDPVAWLL